MNSHEILREEILNKAVVHGKVILSSGKEAEYYVDLRRVTLDAVAAPLVGAVMLELTKDLEIVKEMNLETEIGERTKLSLEQYEELHENKRTPDQSILSGKKEFILVHEESISSDKRGERRYSFVE